VTLAKDLRDLFGTARGTITAEPFMSVEGKLLWRVRQGASSSATLDTTTGKVYEVAGPKSLALRTVLGALREYYETDRGSYAGENARMIRAELEMKGR